MQKRLINGLFIILFVPSFSLCVLCITSLPQTVSHQHMRSSLGDVWFVVRVLSPLSLKVC